MTKPVIPVEVDKAAARAYWEVVDGYVAKINAAVASEPYKDEHLWVVDDDFIYSVIRKFREAGWCLARLWQAVWRLDYVAAVAVDENQADAWRKVSMVFRGL